MCNAVENKKTIMKLKNKFFSTFLTSITLIFILACKQNNSTKIKTHYKVIKFDNQTLKIDTFSTLPPEIDGCSCYFSNDSTEFKSGEYIYMNNYDQISFLKINGVLTKFSQTNFKEIDSLRVKAKYKSDNYQMTIDIKEVIQSGDETWLKIGTIKLTDKKGKTITKTFYGECGC